MTAISGNTYPVKDQLKALGARWDAAHKVWMVADEIAQKARDIVAGTSSSPRCERASTYHPQTCSACGNSPRRDSRGYVEYGTKILTTRYGVLCGECYEEAKMGY